MVYECEKCETALGPGWLECPNCGEKFGEPVPDDAVIPEEEQPAAPAPPLSPSPSLPPPSLPPLLPPAWEWPEEKPPPEKRKRRSRKTFSLPKLPRPALSLPKLPRPALSRPKIAAALAAVLALSGLGWFGYRLAVRLPPSAPSILPLPSRVLRTDLAAHPGYARTMTGFARHLRATGVGAQWPAFGSDDVILITPPLIADGKRLAWDTDSYHGLAQGIWRLFAQYRYQSGFSETDTTTCFVIVTDPSGRVVAVDLMGNLE